MNLYVLWRSLRKLSLYDTTCRSHEFCVMMESSIYSYKIYRFFSKHDVEAHVVHARSLKIVTESDKKTDSNLNLLNV